jgi:hypothetical protein
MTDVATPTAEQPTTNNTSLNATWKGVVTIASLLFNAGIIGAIIWNGDGANSLHTSALAWSYMCGAGILVGLGIGAITPQISAAFARK